VAYNSEYKVSNCIIVGYKGTETDIFENTLRSGDLLLADADARDFRPGVLSPAVDSLAYADLPDEVRRGDGVDLDGRFAVVRNGMATLGAVQDTVPCVVLLGSGGETVSEGWSLGTNLVTAAGNVTITANASRPLIGFEVDGTLLPYSGHSYSFAAPTESGVSKTVKAVYDTNWYVDCVNGNDADDGAFGRPKQTIRAATTNAVAGDVIHVAPGTYGAAEGSQAATSSAKIGTRVVVPAGVTLESTGGATNTFIVGAEATGDQIDNATYGTGTNAIRCVYAKSGAVVRGFTLTGGRGIGVSEASGEGRGAAFCSSAVREAVLEDCIVSNNAAYMATIYQTVVRRCRVIGNIGTRTDNVSAPAGSACNWFDSIIDKNVGGGTVHYPILVEGCTIGANNSSHDGGSPQVIYYNTYEDRAIVNSTILGGRSYFKNGRLFCTNCLILSSMVGANIKVEQSYNTIFTNSASMKLDSDYRPVLGKYVGIDRGDVSVCTALGDGDVYGTPRILNGAIDIGAVEYDWRPTFNAEIGLRFKLTYASPTVTTNATGGLKLDGDVGALGDRALPVCVAGTVREAGPYEFRFEMTGGSAQVFVGGVLAGEASGTGAQSILFNVPDAASEIRFTFTPDEQNPGAAILGRFAGARGFSIAIW
jgi:hypothetical protein